MKIRRSKKNSNKSARVKKAPKEIVDVRKRTKRLFRSSRRNICQESYAKNVRKVKPFYCTKVTTFANNAYSKTSNTNVDFFLRIPSRSTKTIISLYVFLED